MKRLKTSQCNTLNLHFGTRSLVPGLNDATIADAILDRLLHNAIRVELKGDSLRKKQKSLQTEEP
ncbi:MAG: ATP-binding protein, partial [Silvanigrellaceae bacterium]|nr:ATP-binding protein [Silvanigrellaceae bacterium]